MNIGLGDPILVWNTEDAFDTEFRHKAYRILKEWICREQEAIAKRNLGMFHQVTWSTNEIPKQDSGYIITARGDELPEILQKLQVAYQRLSMHAISLREENEDLLIALFYLLHFMRRHGVDPDPSGIIPLIVSKRQRFVQQ